MNLLPIASFKKSIRGMVPSGARGPSAPDDSMLMPIACPLVGALGSVTLAKSAFAGVRLRSHELNIVSTPSMLLFRFGNPMLLRMMWARLPVRTMVPVTLPDESKLLASMLYCVPFWNEVLLYQVFPPVE